MSSKWTYSLLMDITMTNSTGTSAKNLWNNYRQSFGMLLGVALGAMAGIYFKASVPYLRPLGEIFINFLFVLVIPLVFFSMSLSFCRLKTQGQIGKLLSRTLLAFLILWVTGTLMTYFAVLATGPLAQCGAEIGSAAEIKTVQNGASALTEAVSVSDFTLLFSKFHLLPLILFSILFGIGTASAGETGKRIERFLEGGNEVTIKCMEILMKAAPVGLGCYFAYTVSQLGGGVMGGYLKVFVIYCSVALVLMFVIFPLLIRIFHGKSTLRAYSHNIIPPSITALATASSSVAMPGNMEAAEKSGITPSTAQAVIPLATNLMKGGSVPADVLKVMFIMTVCGIPYTGFAAALGIIGLSVLAAIVSGAVTNGGVTGEILICTMLGLRPEMAAVIMVIGTIVDIPATLANSQATVVAAAIADGGKKV